MTSVVGGVAAEPGGVVRASNGLLFREWSREPFGLTAYLHAESHQSLTIAMAVPAAEGQVTVDGVDYSLGAAGPASYRYSRHEQTASSNGWLTIDIWLDPPEDSPNPLQARLCIELAPDRAVLVKSVALENRGDADVHLIGLTIEDITMSASAAAEFEWDSDYVSGPGVVERTETSSAARWIAGYPALERVLAPGATFQSFRLFEFLLPVADPETRGLAYRRALDLVAPWVRGDLLSTWIARPQTEQDFERYIVAAAELGYERVWIHHGPANYLFTNYGDYILRPDFFPGGWDDVRALTDAAHSYGLVVGIYVVHNWIWGGAQITEDARWTVIQDDGTPLISGGPTPIQCPASGFGEYLEGKLVELVERGGFDALIFDGPYYGDVCHSVDHGHPPGAPSVEYSWAAQARIYRRLQAMGTYVMTAAGFNHFMHGANRISTSGYEEEWFARESIWDQILLVRRAAFRATLRMRQETMTFFVPGEAWLNGPHLSPLEENADALDAYLGTMFGYGFGGGLYSRMPFEGPLSEAIVRKWMAFYLRYRDYFAGDLLHVREPDGDGLDAVLHARAGDRPGGLLVVYNPLDEEITGTIDFDDAGKRLLASGSWEVVDLAGDRTELTGNQIQLRVPPHGVVWRELVPREAP